MKTAQNLQMVRDNEPMVASVANSETKRFFEYLTVSLGLVNQTGNPKAFQTTLLMSGLFAGTA